jgi:hypothetical protein
MIDVDDPIKSSLEKSKALRIEINFAARQEAGGLCVQIWDAGHTTCFNFSTTISQSLVILTVHNGGEGVESDHWV